MSIHKHTDDVTVNIPAAIAALTDLNLLEKAALAHIAKSPECSNSNLSKLTGLSERGVESTLARLRKRGFIQRLGEGRARRHKILLHMEHHTPCGKDEVAESHIGCGNGDDGQPHTIGVSKREETTATFIERHHAFYENCFDRGNFEYARKHLEQIRARLELETDLPVEKKAKFIATLADHENRCFALEVGLKMAEKLPRAKQERLALALSNATPDKLALFRQQVEAGQLANNAINVLELTNG